MAAYPKIYVCFDSAALGYSMYGVRVGCKYTLTWCLYEIVLHYAHGVIRQVMDEDLMLCDCPGLVFPSFVSTKAEMVCNGVLPIDQLRDPIPPMVLVANRIPRSILESTYTMQIIRYGFATCMHACISATVLTS